MRGRVVLTALPDLVPSPPGAPCRKTDPSNPAVSPICRSGSGSGSGSVPHLAAFLAVPQVMWWEQLILFAHCTIGVFFVMAENDVFVTSQAIWSLLVLPRPVLRNCSILQDDEMNSFGALLALFLALFRSIFRLK